MTGCSVLGCQSRSEDKNPQISFHTFPLDPILKTQWIRNTGRNNWHPSKYARVCSLHFTAEQIILKKKNKGLISNAVPSSCLTTLPSTSKDITAQPSISNAPKRLLQHEDVEKPVSKIMRVTLPSTSKDVTAQPSISNAPKRLLQHEDVEKPVSKIMRMTLPSTSKDITAQPSISNAPKRLLQHEDVEKPVSKIMRMTLPSTSKDITAQPSISNAPKRLLQHEDVEKPVSKIMRTSMGSSPRKKKMQQKIVKMQQKIVKMQQCSRLLNKKLRAVRQSRRRLIKKTADLKSVLDELKCKLLIGNEDMDLLKNIGEGNADIIKAFLGKARRKKYSEAIRKFALSLNFISPKAYDYVRKEFNTCLPHPRTLSNWYRCIDCEPGFTSESFDVVKNIVDKSTVPLICALSLDEMSIRQHLQWDGHRTIGYVNIGNNLESDNLPLAKDALVLMLTCLNEPWKLPVGYFLTNGVNGEQRKLLVENCIKMAFQSGVQVTAVTFDGCPSNFTMARLLGASFEDPSNIQPVITIDGKKIVIMPDACHMIKLVRNTLGDKKNLMDSNNEIISWDFIEKLHNLQNNEGLHLANKIRNSHVQYKKQIMKVRLATQTFSRSVAESILFCQNGLKLEDFQNCSGTVKFIKLFNDLFDILNSRRLSASGLKKPISEKNWAEIKTVLDAARIYILGLKFLDGQSVINSARKTGFLGFLTCIESIKFLYDYYIRETKYLRYITTFRLSQDHLELFFSAVRSKGGFNNNPTAMQFKAAYKRLLIHGEIKNINSGNCMQADINILTTSSKAVKKINKSKCRLLLIDEDVSNSPENSTDNAHSLEFPEGHDYVGQMCLSQFSKEIVAYIAGFVTKKLTNVIKCDECVAALRCPEKYEGFIAQKDRGGLKYPSQDVVNICTYAESALRELTKVKGLSFLGNVTALPKLVSTILKNFLSKDILINLNEHIKEQNPMDNHLTLLIKAISLKYLEVRIHHMVKMACQKEEKIRNFSNKMVLFKGQ